MASSPDARYIHMATSFLKSLGRKARSMDIWYHATVILIALAVWSVLYVWLLPALGAPT